MPTPTVQASSATPLRSPATGAAIHKRKPLDDERANVAEVAAASASAEVPPAADVPATTPTDSQVPSATEQIEQHAETGTVPSPAPVALSGDFGSATMAVAGGVGLLGLVAAAAGGGGKSGTTPPPEHQRPDPVKPDPVKPDPVKPDPTHPDPTHPDPTHPDPVVTPDPTHPDPVKPDPTHPDPVVTPDPTHPDPVQPDPTHPDPVVTPDPTHPDPVQPDPTHPDPVVTPDPPHPDPVQPDPTHPDPVVTPDPTHPDPVQPDPTHPDPVVTPDPTHPDPVITPDPIPVDTMPPPPPSLALKNDTGPDATDHITGDSTITVAGLEEGGSWRYSVDAGKTWHKGSGQEISTSMFDGDREVQVIQTDAAGNDSQTALLHFTLDTGAPTLALKNDTGRSATDGITNDGTLTVGGLHDGKPWMYSIDAGQSWKTGTGSQIAASELGDDGQKTVWTKQMTSEVTESGISAFTFTLDTHVSAITPKLKTIDSMDGSLPVTSNPVIVFEGYEEGSAIRTTIWETDIGTRAETVMGLGELPMELQPGRVSLSEIVQTDIAGNATAWGASGVLDFIVAPPVLP